MVYKLCPPEIGVGMIELDSSRADIERAVTDTPERFQLYADAAFTGCVYVWAIEYSTINRREKATAALYQDQQRGFIWLEIR